MDIQLLQEYVDAALAEIGVSNLGPGRARARPDKADPANKARVRVHRLASKLDFASRLLSLVQRQGWRVKLSLDELHGYIEVTT